MQGDSFWTTEDAVPPWPRLDVCRPRLARNLNSRRLLCPRFTGGKIRRPSLWSKGMVSGSVLFNGRRGCIDQEDDVLFLPLPPCCSIQSHKYTRGKRKTFQSFTGQPQRHSTRQKQRQSKHSFVTAHNETTASVSYHKTCQTSSLFRPPFSMLVTHNAVACSYFVIKSTKCMLILTLNFIEHTRP